MGRGEDIMKVRMRNILFIGVVLLSAAFLTGCSTLETLLQKDGTSASFGDWIGGNNNTTSLPAMTTAADGKTIALYFPDASGKYLVKEERTLPKTVSLARETVNQWLKGPAVKGTSALAAVSASTTLLDIAIKDNVATVDLSKEFLQPSAKVSPEAALYGLVNTLTQYSTIKEVHIRVEGKALSKYGTTDTTHLMNKASLVKGTISNNAGALNSGAATEGQGTGTTGATSNTGLGTSATDKSSNGALPDSPSAINLFSFPPSST